MNNSRALIAHSSIAILTFVMFPWNASGQSNPEQDQEKAYARTPKEIAFQNDSQWEDNRWQQTDVGPFLAGTLEAGKGLTLKGIAIRVGEQNDAAVCFDTARLRISAAWTGDFLQFEPRRFGLIRPPRAAGKYTFVTDKLAGWAKQGRFQPEPAEITIPEAGYPANTSETHLPKDWAHFKGMYTSGPRVVLSYTVGAVQVLESPWFVRSGTDQAFIRSLEIGPSSEVMQMWVADHDSQVTVIGSAAASLDDRQPILTIAPHEQAVRLKLLITTKGKGAEAIASLRQASGDVEDLSEMIASDEGRFHDVLVTAGETTETDGPYVIDTLTLPFENPWNALLFTAGHDFFSDGTGAVCTVHGDVWTVAGVDRELKQLRWRRFATGLCQPLGLKIVDDKVYVIGRNQITRLHDRNGDGEADFYENFNNDLIIAPRAHDYVTCLDTDPDGNFHFIHALTGVMRVSADGSSLTSVADGFRNPNGMAVGPNGMITAAPQQGTWTPESSLIVVQQGGYYGYGGPRYSDNRSSGWDLPMCFIPRAMDNSGGAQVWVEGNRWGPLEGQMLHLSYGQCRFLLALVEEVDGVYQGGTIQFPTKPADFESGIMRGRFSPHDGQLYLSGLRGWQTRAIRDGCLQRVRYTGGPVHLPTAVKTYQNGIQLTFSEPLARSLAENPDNYFVEQWNYLWSKDYGSPDFKVSNPQEQGRDEVPVVSATLLDDDRSIFLEMPGRHPVNQITISWLLQGQESADGDQAPFRGTFAHTINTNPTTAYPESKITRRSRRRRISAEVEQRLEPGLEFRFQSNESGQVDLRTSRLVALRQPITSPATPFLTTGPFSLQASGTLRTPLSGFYDFKIESSGVAELWINDQLLIDGSLSNETSQSILLHKGHNPIRVHYESPDQGTAELQLLWKGHNFGWEPVPPQVFFHDAGSEDLRKATQLRHGRELFANLHCAACHKTDVESQGMFEMSLVAPDLSAAGQRFTKQWLEQWLLAPHSLQSDTPMPAMLGDGDSAKQAAADIATFLLTDRTGIASSSETTSTSELIDQGVVLYEKLGCIACHHFEPDAIDGDERVSLHYADAKFPPGTLAEFLRKPNRHHQSIRMPDFRLTAAEANALAALVREDSKGSLSEAFPEGDAARGQKLFSEKGCQQCHRLGDESALAPARLAWKRIERATGGCLAETVKGGAGVANFLLAQPERQALRAFVTKGRNSLSRSIAVETSQRLFKTLRCANCHDRDGLRADRALLIAEEGSGDTAEQLPQLTMSGEKLQPGWTRSLLAGEVAYKSRPWLVARMPAFAAYAEPLATGLACEHGIDPAEPATDSFDRDLATIGEKLTLQTGLDCRQCHAIGSQQPRGDDKTKIALGINFTFIRERMRPDAYHRFMLDPPRYDINTKMIRLSENGLTTKLKAYFDADAKQQFNAVWQYMQSLPDASTLPSGQER